MNDTESGSTAAGEQGSAREAAAAAFDAATLGQSEESSEAHEENLGSPEKEATKQTESAEKTKAIDYEKSFKELQAEYTRSQQRVKNFEKRFEGVDLEKLDLKKLQNEAKLFKEIDDRYQNDAKWRQTIDGLLGKQVDPSLAEDPLFQHLQKMENAYQARISQLENQLKPIVEGSRKQQAMEKLNQAEGQIRSIYKETFGADIPDDAMTRALSFMYEKQIHDGNIVAKEVFWKEALEAAKQRALSEQMEKKGKGARTTTAGPQNPDAGKKYDLRESILKGLEAQGY